jgi:hypothetical protein
MTYSLARFTKTFGEQGEQGEHGELQDHSRRILTPSGTKISIAIPVA